jgi:hypothetical protein
LPLPRFECAHGLVRGDHIRQLRTPDPLKIVYPDQPQKLRAHKHDAAFRIDHEKTVDAVEYLFNVFYPFLVIPTICTTILSLFYFGELRTVGSFFVAFGCIFSAALAIVLVNMVCVLMRQNPHLRHISRFAWVARTYFLLLPIHAVPISLSFILYKTNVIWHRFIPPIVKLLIDLFSLSQLKLFPFPGFGMNAFFAGGLVGCSLASLMSILMDAGVGISGALYFFLPFSAIALMTAYYRHGYAKRCAMMIDQMTYSTAFPGRTDLTDARAYLVVGFENGCDLFLDWSISRYTINLWYTDPDTLILVSWMASLFPAETLIWRDCLIQGSQIQSPTAFHQGFFYQLHRVHLFRQNSGSKEATNDLYALKEPHWTYSVSRTAGLGGSPSRATVMGSSSTQLSMFQVPSLVQLMTQGDAETDAYNSLSLDFLMIPI